MKHLVVFDTHAHPDHKNDRADWLGRLIVDTRPDVIIHGGDSADLPSLASYDKGKRAALGRNYRDDIDSHLEFLDRMFHPLKKQKKRKPKSYFFIGNHEQRIEKTLDLSPELEGTISLNDLELDRYFDHVVPYTGGTPGSLCIDGVHYSHYFVSGIMGKAIGGEHPGATLVAKKHSSCTMGHQHVLSYSRRTVQDGKKVAGLVAPCYQDYDSAWAGENICKLWDKGLIIKNNVEDGVYDLNFISLEGLKNEYGR